MKKIEQKRADFQDFFCRQIVTLDNEFERSTFYQQNVARFHPLPRPRTKGPQKAHTRNLILFKKQKKQNTHEIVKQMGQLSSSMRSPRERERPRRGVLERNP
jgi:hypothetical protein